MINTNRADGLKSVVSLVITWAIFSLTVLLHGAGAARVS